jgi:hypothetical protein
MKTRFREELYWLLGTMSLTLVIGLLFFGRNLFNGRLLDLQLHDTYIIFPKSFFMAGVFIFLLTGTYLNRGIYRKLNKRSVSILLTIILALLLFVLISYWDFNYGYLQDAGYYLFDERSQTERISDFLMTHWSLIIIILVTSVTIFTTGYKIIKPKQTN